MTPSNDSDRYRAQLLVDEIKCALAVAQEPGGADGYAAQAHDRLCEALMWAEKNLAQFPEPEW
jgi:hypothetical protein